MLAPLLVAQCDLVRDGTAIPIQVGRGQLLGIHGHDREMVFSRVLDAARRGSTPFHLIEAGAELSLPPPGDTVPLWLIRFDHAPSEEMFAPYLAAAETLGQQGGGAVFTAEALPRQGLTAHLTFPPEAERDETAPNLLDDGGQPVQFLRQGEWGALRFPLADFSLRDYRAVQLRLSGPGGRWDSEPRSLAPWQTLVLQPNVVFAEFSALFPPGNYQADLFFRRAVDAAHGEKAPGTGRKQPAPTASAELVIRSAAFGPSSGERHVSWRFIGAAGVPRRAAGQTLRLPPREQLTMGWDHEDYLLSGWDNPEQDERGVYRRWTQRHASCALGGTGRIVHLDLWDHRPRPGGPDPTTLTARIDGGAPHRWSWLSAGHQRLEMPWPDDPFSHHLTLEVQPDWTPSEYGNPDDVRRLGVLVHDIRISNAP